MAYILLTGSTGLLGSVILRELLLAKRPVAVLVRPRGGSSAQARVDRLLEYWDGVSGAPIPRPVVLEGSLDDPDLGLGARARRWAAEHCTEVLNSAARVTFIADRDSGEPYRTNVDGVKHLLAFSRNAHIERFHQVSTAYVCGLRSGPILSSELDCGQSFRNDYERSKFLAEIAVREADLPFVRTIYRPSIIVGDSKTGYSSVFRGIYAPIRLAYLAWQAATAEQSRVRIEQFGLRGDETKNVVPVDWVAACIREIVLDSSLQGHTYHLTSPEPIATRRLEEAMVAAIAVAGSTPQSDPIPPGLLDDDGPRRYMEPFREYLESDPDFDASTTASALPGLPCPHLDLATLVRLTRFAIAARFGAGSSAIPPLPAADRPVDRSSPARASASAGGIVDTPVAVVGLSCRLPGADGPDELWELLSQGRDEIRELPSERLNRELYYDPRRGVTGRTYSTIGGLIREPLSDHGVISFSESELADADPCHIIFCTVAAEALASAGYDPERGSAARVGVYVGHSAGSPLGGDLAISDLAAEAVDYLHDVDAFADLPTDVRDAVAEAAVRRLRERLPCRNADGGPRTAADEVAGLAARKLHLSGPTLAVDAACASSLVALALGVLALQRGQIDAALIGGASYNKADSLILFSQAQSCSASGSRPFDNEADGLVSSEGYVALVLKTLPRALADGDRVHAVIRGIGLSSDGRARSLWAPRKEGQLEALARAYGRRLDPGLVSYIEAHATGTQVGDSSELEALEEFFAPHLDGERIAVGSIKSNLGHTLETAGLAGLLKVVLALRRHQLPPTINLRRLNRPQSRALEIPTELRPWPRRADRPRRAAVSAFGIGGLNVHLVVDEFSPEAAAAEADAPIAAPSAVEAVAVIGRGVVLPGAFSVDQLATLLESGRSAIGDPPPDRRRRVSDRCWRGGFLRDWQYDWRRLMIPPKQIARANPMQFMLLDAAEQAFAEAGFLERPFDRRRTAVVVGTIFGGDFGHQLQVGLRLPELRREIADELARHGADEELIARIGQGYEKTVLAAKPALLDETGSFTASTLASRIAKTFDLMGGALAIDAGDVSSLTALDAAIQLLQSGACDAVLCAGAQGAVDLNSPKLFVPRGSSADGKTEAAADARYLPGEGVAVVLLKRLSDARRDNDRVLAVIRAVDGCFEPRVERAVEEAAKRALAAAAKSSAEVSTVDSGCGLVSLDQAENSGLRAVFGTIGGRQLPSLVAQIGHTRAAHGMAALIRATLPAADDPVTSGPILVAVSSISAGGRAYQLLVERPRQARAVDLGARLRVEGGAERAESGILRLGAGSPEELDRTLARVAAMPFQSSSEMSTGFAPGDVWRLAIVNREPQSWAARLSLARRLWQDARARPALERQGIFAVQRPQRRPRIAFAFPGQGSQYPGMLSSLISRSAAARQASNDADRALQKEQVVPFAELSADRDSLDSQPLVTQLSMLVADLVVAAAVAERGIRPDCVFGHSYGELPAMVVAGVWSLEQAIRATKVRCAAIGTGVGGLLSVAADAESVAAWLGAFDGELEVTHVNAPSQTVVGGPLAALGSFADDLTGRGIAARILPVPGALHTAMMGDAQQRLREALAEEPLRPPTTLFLGGVTNRYLAEPDECRRNLVEQLCSPVRYVELVERIVNDGVSVLLEVGPGQVLTGLHRQILATGETRVVPTDSPQRDQTEQLDRVQAICECFDLVDTQARSAPELSAANPPRPIEEFDATAARRRSLRAESVHPAVTPPAASAGGGTPPPVLHDLLIDFVVEQTGYPREVVDLDWDLEADLGIDSIRRAQLLGEMAELVGSTSRDTQDLSHLRTLRQLGHHFEQLFDPGASAPQSSQEHSGTTVAAGSDGRSQVERLVLEFASEHTGFPLDSIRLDADLEADLGIDGAKKQQLLGELCGHLGLSIAKIDPVQLAALHTLIDVVAYVGSAPPERKDLFDRSQPERAPDPRTAPSAAVCVGHGGGAEGVSPAAMRPQQRANRTGSEAPERQARERRPLTSRHVLRLVPAPQRPGAPRQPRFYGTAVILGHNPTGEALRDRLAELDVPAILLPSAVASDEVVRQLEEILELGPVPHLFVVTSRDPDAGSTFDLAQWEERRAVGILSPFWVCQRWYRSVREAGLMERASLVAVISLGGDFGFSGHVPSAEGGAMAGLLKALVVESWVHGHRTTPIKVIDAPPAATPAEITTAVLRELAVPSYEMEVSWSGDERRVVRAQLEPLAIPADRRPRRGGSWICTGGARGITALVASELARRYRLRLHLIGTAPRPTERAEEQRALTPAEQRSQKIECMRAARERGDNPVRAWQDRQKAVEIEETLSKLRALSIAATYHSCDIADRGALGTLLEEIRRNDGPIVGVLHGAGYGKDSRFDDKQAHEVERCIRAKVDGALALMELTREDPLDAFVAFGSISGRFGANGHTDYSLANEMLAKLVGWYRGQRPEVAATTFHWHAWDDVGMATKPETRLALEMIGMHFMPSGEGLRHVVAELENGVKEPEVLITDNRYCRLFTTGGIMDADANTSTTCGPLLATAEIVRDADEQTMQLTLDPRSDPFLNHHRLHREPLLPLAVGLELLAEAAARTELGEYPATLRSVTVLHGLRFFNEQARTVTIRTRHTADEGVLCRLVADEWDSDGRVLAAQRTYLRAIVDGRRETAQPAQCAPSPPAGDWTPVTYPDSGSSGFFHGLPLRCLRSFALDGDLLWGRISAPLATELGGVERIGGTWCVPAAALDACLYAAGILAWCRLGEGSTLPVAIGCLHLGRMPDPGEACLVECRFRGWADQLARFDFWLYGCDGGLLVSARDYRMAWLDRLRISPEKTCGAGRPEPSSPMSSCGASER